MPVIERSALLPCSAATLYGIVNDVARYPEFLPWCADAEVLEASETEIVAELALRARGISERFTTRNLLMPHERIELRHDLGLRGLQYLRIRTPRQEIRIAGHIVDDAVHGGSGVGQQSRTFDHRHGKTTRWLNRPGC